MEQIFQFLMVPGTLRLLPIQVEQTNGWYCLSLLALVNFIQ